MTGTMSHDPNPWNVPATAVDLPTTLADAAARLMSGKAVHRPLHLEMKLPDGTPFDRKPARGREEPKPAALCVPLAESADGLEVLVTVRARSLAGHPGQVALPGGRIEDSDRDPFEAALRELREEVGIGPEQVEKLAELRTTYTRRRHYLIHPFAVAVRGRATVMVEPAEVESAHWLPLATLVGTGSLSTEYKWRYGSQVLVPYLRTADLHIHGATALILEDLLIRLARPIAVAGNRLCRK